MWAYPPWLALSRAALRHSSIPCPWVKTCSLNCLHRLQRISGPRRVVAFASPMISSWYHSSRYSQFIRWFTNDAKASSVRAWSSTKCAWSSSIASSRSWAAQSSSSVYARFHLSNSSCMARPS